MASKPSEGSKGSPWFWLIAGPNGSGKSTWADSEECRAIIGNIPILNPDQFSKPYALKSVSLVTAGKRIFREVEQLTKDKKDFAVETTLSGTQYFRLATRLKNNGWCIGAVYIGVEGEDVCISRVLERELKGGHGVPLKDIVRRYTRSLSHISNLLMLSDYLIILDNSKQYEQVLESRGKDITIKRNLPSWLKDVFEE